MSVVKDEIRYINQDVRLNNQVNLNKILERNFSGGRNGIADLNEKGREQRLKINEALAELKKNNPTADVAISPVTGNVEVVKSSKYLTGSSRRDARNIALDFVRENKEL